MLYIYLPLQVQEECITARTGYVTWFKTSVSASVSFGFTK